jgi:hypothetical protein
MAARGKINTGFAGITAYMTKLGLVLRGGGPYSLDPSIGKEL